MDVMAADLVSGAQWLGAFLGAGMTAAVSIWRFAPLLVKRLHPGANESASQDLKSLIGQLLTSWDRNWIQVHKEILDVTTRMNEAAVAMQHSNTVQDEIVASLREYREGWVRTTELQRDIGNQMRNLGELLGESHEMIRSHAEEDRLAHVQIKSETKAMARDLDDVTNNVRELRLSFGNGKG